MFLIGYFYLYLIDEKTTAQRAKAICGKSREKCVQIHGPDQPASHPLLQYCTIGFSLYNKLGLGTGAAKDIDSWRKGSWK
jgi:hypothetical protein